MFEAEDGKRELLYGVVGDWRSDVSSSDLGVMGIQKRVRIQELLDHHGQGLRAVFELQLNVPARANAQVSLWTFCE